MQHHWENRGSLSIKSILHGPGVKWTTCFHFASQNRVSISIARISQVHPFDHVSSYAGVEMKWHLNGFAFVKLLGTYEFGLDYILNPGST
jgi:hypothetical protein